MDRAFFSEVSCLPTLRLITATYSSRCLEAFHCSSAVSGWWSIATWANGRHSFFPSHLRFSTRIIWFIIDIFFNNNYLYKFIFNTVTSCGIHDSFLSKRSGRRHDSWIYARESNRIHLLTILRSLLNSRFIRSFLKTHKSHLRKIPIEKCIVLEEIKS